MRVYKQYLASELIVDHHDTADRASLDRIRAMNGKRAHPTSGKSGGGKKEKGLPIAGATPLSYKLESALSLSLYSSSSTYKAGQSIHGKLVLGVNLDNLYLSELELELTAYEGESTLCSLHWKER